MKVAKLVLPLLSAIILLTSAVLANEPAKAKKQLSFTHIEKNYLSGLKSENEGLKLSSAYWLGEMKSKDAVNPLMRILHFSDKENNRILAALSLYKIASDKSLYALKMAAKFDSSERVRKMCATFYNHYHKSLN